MTPGPQSQENDFSNKDISSDVQSDTSKKQRYERGTAFDVFATHEEQDAKHSNNDIANNDGSIVASMDQVLHGEAASVEHNDFGGSNREDYNEANEVEKSDIEEEMDAIEKKPSA